MATYYSNLYATSSMRGTASGAETAVNSYAYKGPYGKNAGEVVHFEGTFTIPAALATSDLANLLPLPPGAQLTSLFYYNADCGTTVTTVIEVDTTDLLAGIALGTAVALASEVALTAAQYSLGWAANATAEKNLRLAFTSVSTPTAGALFYFRGTYAMPS
jgi:hypothetical protein